MNKFCSRCAVTESHCDNCSRCKGCQGCNCRRCTNGCNRWFIIANQHSYCERCHVCRRCCRCRNSPKYTPDYRLGISEIITKGGTKGRSVVTGLPRTLGMELEIGDWKNLSRDGGNNRIPGISYITTHDWSVKPSEMEMVISPLRGDAVIRGMLELSRAGTTAGIVLNESCALHVHVGGKDLSYFEIRRLLEVYSRLEREIYSHLIAPHRTQNPSIHYCQMMTGPHVVAGCERCRRYDQQYPEQRVIPEPLSSVLSRMWMATTTEDLKLCLLRMLYGIENPSHIPDVVRTRKGGHYEFCRYFGLNLHSWMHRLTVEFRMKEATVDPIELVMWPLWCGWFVHAITRMSDADARNPQLSVRSFTDRWMPKYLGEYIGMHKL